MTKDPILEEAFNLQRVYFKSLADGIAKNTYLRNQDYMGEEDKDQLSTILLQILNKKYVSREELFQLNEFIGIIND